MTLIIAAALKTVSSDVHIEAEETEIAVRMRVDGVLQHVKLLFLRINGKSFISAKSVS